MTQLTHHGFNNLSDYLYFRKRSYDAVNGKIYDESFLNGDARAVQPGRCYKGDGVDADVVTDFKPYQYYGDGAYTKQISWGCYFRRPSGISNYEAIFGQENPANAGGVVIWMTNTGLVYFRGEQELDVTGRFAHVTSSAYDDGDWHSAVAVLDHPNLYLYIDEALIETIDIEVENGNTKGVGFRNEGVGNSTNILLVGRDGDLWFNGYVFAPFIYDGAMTANEVGKYHNGTFDWSRMLRIWPCDEGGGTDSFEKNGSGIGTIRNADLSLFHHQGGDVPFSFQNRLGYTYDQTNDRFIPRNESNPTLDVQGNPLQYSGKVPYDIIPKRSNTGKFDQSAHIGLGYGFNFVNTTGVFYIKAICRAENLTGDASISYIIVGNRTFARERFIFDLRDDGQLNFVISNDSTSFQVSVQIASADNPMTDLDYHTLEVEGDGSTAVVRIDGVQLGSDNITGLSSNNSSENAAIGAANEGHTSRAFYGDIAYVKIENPNNSNEDAELLIAEGGLSNTVHDRINNYHGTLLSADIQDFWSRKQNVIHEHIRKGFDLWKHDASGELIRVILRGDESSVLGENDTKSGWTWQSKHLPSGKFHNYAESVLDTEADNPLHYQLKQETGDAGIHPDNAYSSDRFFKRDDGKEADRFVGYDTVQEGKRLQKIQNFTS